MLNAGKWFLIGPLKNDGGSVLVLVLVVMAIATGLSLYVANVAHNTLNAAFYLDDKLKATLEAESQLEKIRYLLVARPLGSSAVLAGENDFAKEMPARLSLTGDEFVSLNSSIRLYDTSSMLTLPWLSGRLLENYLLKKGISAADSAHAKDAWLDWVDQDDFARLNGMEKTDYLETGINAWTPRNSAAVQAVEELQLIAGIGTQGVWRTLKNELVWTGRAGNNLNTADEDMLEALLDIPPEQAKQLVLRRKEMGKLTETDILAIVGKTVSFSDGQYFNSPNFVVAVYVKTSIGEAEKNIYAVIDALPPGGPPGTVMRYEQ